MNQETLEAEQPIVAAFLKNARQLDRMPHALLLYGDNLAPVDEVASFFAKSLYCDRQPLACGKCESCRRFDESRITDFYELNGQAKTIRKEQVADLAENFVLRTKEKKHLAVYIVREVSNITAEAANALLKFLEEPPEAVQAILTTTGREKILPTILSRVISLRVLPVQPKYEEGSIDPKVALLAESLRSDREAVYQLAADKDFNRVFALAEEFLDALVFNREKGLNTLFASVAEQLKDSTCYNYFYNIVYQVFLRILNRDETCPYKDVVIGLRPQEKNIAQATSFLEEILASPRLNFNFTLVLGKLATLLEA